MGRDEGKPIVQIPSLFFLVFSGVMCLLPFSMFILPEIDMWVGNGLFFQFGMFLLFLISFVDKGKNDVVKGNVPLIVFALWCSISTSMMFYDAARAKFFNFLNIFAFISLLTFFFFYRIVSEYMTREKMKKALWYLSISVSIIVFYCLIQKLNLDQFQHPTVELESLPLKDRRDFLVGTIGNPTHLASYLAISLPLFYRLNSNFSFFMSCLVWAIIGWTGSASGLLTAVSVTVFYGFFFRLKSIAIAIIGVVFYSILFFSKGFDILEISKMYMNPSGRIEMWGRLFDIWRAKPLFGYGLGFLNYINKVDSSIWSHAHCEALQTALELGLVGLVLAFWCVVDFFRTFWKTAKSSLEVSLASMFLGFIVSGFFNFPAHIWMISSLGMMAYSFMYVIKNEEENSYND